MDIIDDYKQRAATAQVEADKYKRLVNKYAIHRLLAFGLFILSICVAIGIDEITIIGISLIVLIFLFSWLVKKQAGYEKLKDYFLDVKKVCDNEINSIQFNKNVYNNGELFNNEKHHYSSDLDIYGDNSLFSLINRSATFPGCLKLARWLNAPAEKNEILARQQAVNEIAAKNDWKIDIQAHLLFSVSQRREQINNLISYLKIPIELEDKKWINAYCKVAPYLMLATIILSVFYVPARYFVPIIALFNNRQVSSRKKIIDKTDLIAGRIGTTLFHFVSAFERIESENWQSQYLQNLVSKLKNSQAGEVSVSIQQLSRLIDKLNYRLNLVVKFILNFFLLWDIRQIIAIENWKRNNTENLESAFDVIAEFEALISLSSLRINYPDWCMPEIVESNGYTLTAKGLAHPLISSQKRVENDYELDDTFKIDIITGSNMAGKSTFLRTIGLNAVLALCGAPVCAKKMTISVITIISYMRIKDNLNESTSTFKAELDRLQMLLATVDKGNKVFFLIDEMLRGTNSVDKYLGSKAIIEQLIRKNGVGLVATHDLQIAELEHAHPAYVRNFYFDIQVKDGDMLFDYKIKPGACKTFNASLLLKQIGIEVG